MSHESKYLALNVRFMSKGNNHLPLHISKAASSIVKRIKKKSNKGVLEQRYKEASS